MLLLLLLLSSTLLKSAATLNHAQLVEKYNALKTEFHQNMPRSSDDEKEHFLEFKETADFIQSHNCNEGDEWQADYNKFSTMTFAEKETYTGLNVSTVVLQQRNSKFVRRSIDLAKRNPSSVDYTSKLPAIKNQGSCGSCWTFGATAALEYQVNRGRSGSLKTLAEQQYLDCVYEGSRDGCNGGWPTACYDWTRDNGNMIASLADMPYKGSDGTCKTNVKSAISGFEVGGSIDLEEGDSAMEDAVADSSIGVISVAIGVVNSFYSFSSGIYSGSGCSSVNHAVDVVGYGKQSGVGYWRVRNSWGNWGDNGYINMKRGLNGDNINMCSISSYGHYPIVTGSDDGSDDDNDNNDNDSDDVNWCMYEGKYLSGYSSGCTKKYTTLDAAASQCLVRSDCGGITYEASSSCSLKYTLRRGTTLKKSRSGEISWLVCEDDGSDDEEEEEDKKTCKWSTKENNKLKGKMSGLEYTLAQAKTACLDDKDTCLGISCKSKNKCMLNKKSKGTSDNKYTAYTYSC